MIPIDRSIRRLLFWSTLLCPRGASPAAFGQDGEELVDDGPIVPQVVMPVQVARAVQFNPEQVDQWIFSRWGGLPRRELGWKPISRFASTTSTAPVR